MYKLVILRHGESEWNRVNRFTGWVDVDLSERGQKEARSAGALLRSEGYRFDAAYTSVLKRAIRTMQIALLEMEHHWIEVRKHWRLNERHYGSLQGMNKAEMSAKVGEEQVAIWRRSYDTPPPPLDEGSEYSAANDPRYAMLPPDDVPVSECLKDTVDRFLPYWNVEIAPRIVAGEKILIVAHGNSLRALAKHIEHISDADIAELNIPTGIPLVYELDRRLSPIRRYYLGDQAAVDAAMSAVANQAKAK